MNTYNTTYVHPILMCISCSCISLMYNNKNNRLIILYTVGASWWEIAGAIDGESQL
jgi:hypothetical protein